ncbi:hypothetical protein AAF712_006113 [Marasmius tenuissimus]|uniref:F-box domain-containing protein n=1 Tax=Marasmius tenuissimus TaxID=585030 RepID=A0ABR3A1L4_9AGAR
MKDDYPQEIRRMVWDVILPHLNRCKELRLDIDGADLPAVQDLSFPVLETFDLASCLATYDDVYDWLSRAIERAAKLTKIVPFTPQASVPYSQLRMLKIRAMRQDNAELLLSHLSDCKAFERLDILIQEEPSDEDLPTMDVTLPSLHQLRIDVHVCTDASTIVRALLHSLAMPTLVTFKLSQDRWPGSDVLHILARRSPLLHRLELTTNGVGEELNTSTIFSSTLLSFLPNLSHLQCFIFKFASAFVDASDAIVHADLFTAAPSWLLTRLSPNNDHSESESSVSFLPNLRHIHLETEDTALDPSVVHKFQEVTPARVATGPLRELYLTLKGENVRTMGGHVPIDG